MVRLNETVIWHDVECASYSADLDVWEELAAGADGPLLDIGCGTGRVALHLAALGHEVVGLDSEPDLIQALGARSRAAGLSVDGAVADARSFELAGRTFALAIAPMQVVQLLGGSPGRAAMLATVRRHLQPGGGTLAIALADPFEGGAGESVGPPHSSSPRPPRGGARRRRAWPRRCRTCTRRTAGSSRAFRSRCARW